MSATQIAIFAKAPIEGFAKTRLIPRLGAQGAADLQERLIERTVAIAVESKLGPVSLWCAPDCTHPIFSEIADRYAVSIHLQSGRDLGECLIKAFAYLTSYGRTLLMGTDCVVMDTHLLKRCADSLRDGSDAVFLPVEDGGYILVGLNKHTPELFRDMPWTSEHVMPETRKRARDLNLRIDEPKILWDIDLPEDYERALANGAL